MIHQPSDLADPAYLATWLERYAVYEPEGRPAVFYAAAAMLRTTPKPKIALLEPKLRQLLAREQDWRPVIVDVY